MRRRAAALVVAAAVAYRAIRERAARGAGSGTPANGLTIERTLTVRRPPEELHRLWREPSTLPAVMEGFAEVEANEAGRARWTLHAPLGRTPSWETQIVDDRPGDSVHWRTVTGTAPVSEGTLRFRPGPGDWGTEVSLVLRFEPPGGPLRAAATKLLRIVPDNVASNVLRRFKSLAETGEVPTTERQPAARSGGRD